MWSQCSQLSMQVHWWAIYVYSSYINTLYRKVEKKFFYFYFNFYYLKNLIRIVIVLLIFILHIILLGKKALNTREKIWLNLSNTNLYALRLFLYSRTLLLITNKNADACIRGSSVEFISNDNRSAVLNFSSRMNAAHSGWCHGLCLKSSSAAYLGYGQKCCARLKALSSRRLTLHWDTDAVFGSKGVKCSDQF